MQSRSRLLRLVLFSAAALIFCGAGLLPGRILLPLDGLADLPVFQPNPTAKMTASNRLLSDVILQFVPWDAAARRALGHGQVPWRNPGAGNGAPLFANPQAALLFPLTWLRFLADFRGWGLSVFLKLVAIAFGTAWLAAEMGAAAPAAAISGLVAEMSGFSIVWAFHPHTNVFCVLPALAASMLRLWRRHAPGNLALVILLSALATAGGHPETLACGVSGIAIFLAALPREKGEGRPLRLLRVAGACAIGFLLLSIQLVPFAGLARRSVTAGSRAAWGAGSFRWAASAGTLLPGFLGAPLRGEIDLTPGISGSENFISRSQGYVGLVVPFLVALAWRTIPAIFRRGVLVGIFCLAVAWRVPPFGLLRSHLPIFSLGAAQFWIVPFVIFTSAAAGPALVLAAASPRRKVVGLLALTIGLALTAIGLAPRFPSVESRLATFNQHRVMALRETGLRLRPRDAAEDLARESATALRRAALPGLCLLFAGVELVRRKSRPAVLAIAVVGELAAFGFGFLPSLATTDIPPPPESIAAVRRLDPADRFCLAAGPGVFPPNLATFYGRRDPRSYDLLGDAEKQRQLKAAGLDEPPTAFRSVPSPAELQALGALSVRYFFSRSEVEGAARVGGLPPPAVGVYEIAAAIPSPFPADSPPDGIQAGAALSLFAAAGGAIWIWKLARRASEIRQTDINA